MSPRFTLRRLGAVVAAAALTLGLAACSGGTDTGGSTAPANGGAPEVTDLAVGHVPVADQAALFQAVNQGYFTDEGLNVTPQTAQGGAAAVPAMVAGDLDAVFGTYPSFLLAQQNVAELKIVSLGVAGSENFAGVFVSPQSGITTIQDLAGKKLAVNTLNNTGDLTVKSVLKENNVDPAQVEFLEMPFPDMAAALERGNVDAAWAVEPFQTALLEAGNTKLFSNFSGRTATIPLAGIAMTADFVDQNPNTAAAFARAMEKANADLAANPDIARELTPTYSQTSTEVANKMQLPTWKAGYPAVQDIELWNEVMVDGGALTEPIDLEKMIFTPPAQ